MRSLLTVVLLGALVLAGCTSGGDPAPSPSTRTETSTRTQTSSAPVPPVAAGRFVAPLPPGQKPAPGERERLCPYIRSGVEQDPTTLPNVADIQGNHVYRTTVLTRLRPVGCRFYFYAPDYQAVADIVPRTYATPTAAYNAMVRTAKLGSQNIGVPDFASGVDGISYRTRFYRPDGDQDWAFAFAKGRVMVVVHTEEKTTSQNALYLAKAIVSKF